MDELYNFWYASEFKGKTQSCWYTAGCRRPDLTANKNLYLARELKINCCHITFYFKLATESLHALSKKICNPYSFVLSLVCVCPWYGISQQYLIVHPMKDQMSRNKKKLYVTWLLANEVIIGFIIYGTWWFVVAFMFDTSQTFTILDQYSCHEILSQGLCSISSYCNLSWVIFFLLPQAIRTTLLLAMQV